LLFQVIVSIQMQKTWLRFFAVQSSDNVSRWFSQGTDIKSVWWFFTLVYLYSFHRCSRQPL